MSEKPTIVVGIDGNDHSLLALRRALAEAELRGAALHIVHAVDVSPAVLHLGDGVTVNTTDVAEAQRLKVWEKAGSVIEESDGPVEKVDLDGYPADALVDYCEEVGADLLVLGTRGRGRLSSTFLGSTSMRALERANCDVLIVKGT